MSLWKFVKGHWTERSPDWTYLPIPPERVDRPLQGAIRGPDGGYLRLRIRELHLAECRRGFTRMFPLIHSSIRMRYAGREVEISSVAGPGQVNGFENARLERILQLNHTVLDAIPYRSGDVEFLLCLLAAESEDFLDRFLNLLGRISHSVKNTEVALFHKISSAIKDGVDEIFGLGKLNLLLGVRDALSADAGTGAPIAAGYRALIAAPRKRVPHQQLRVQDSQLVVGEDGARLEGLDYILISVEVLQQRDDWNELPSIAGAFAELRARALAPEQDGLQKAYETFMGVVIASPDLVEEDRFRVIAAGRALVGRLGKLRSAGLTLESVARSSGTRMESTIPVTLADAVASADPEEARRLARGEWLQLP